MLFFFVFFYNFLIYWLCVFLLLYCWFTVSLESWKTTPRSKRDPNKRQKSNQELFPLWSMKLVCRLLVLYIPLWKIHLWYASKLFLSWSLCCRAPWDLWRGQLLQRSVEDDACWWHSRSALPSQRHGWAYLHSSPPDPRSALESNLPGFEKGGLRLWWYSSPSLCLHTGLILRRCSLDEEGVAYWENPTYMKCISNDYRSIQTLVSIEKVCLFSYMLKLPLIVPVKHNIHMSFQRQVRARR